MGFLMMAKNKREREEPAAPQEAPPLTTEERIRILRERKIDLLTEQQELKKARGELAEKVSTLRERLSRKGGPSGDKARQERELEAFHPMLEEMKAEDGVKKRLSAVQTEIREIELEVREWGRVQAWEAFQAMAPNIAALAEKAQEANEAYCVAVSAFERAVHKSMAARFEMLPFSNGPYDTGKRPGERSIEGVWVHLVYALFGRQREALSQYAPLWAGHPDLRWSPLTDVVAGYLAAAKPARPGEDEHEGMIFHAGEHRWIPDPDRPGDPPKGP
jgi:hypothetical protein